MAPERSSGPTSRRVGVDTGGTFTDVVAEDGSSVKVPSTPADPSAAVKSGIERFAQVGTLAHGTTVATNALLERRGGRVALLTTEGHRDVLEIARQARPSLYDLWADRPAPLVPRDLRFEVPGRLDASGAELSEVDWVPELPAGLDAVAVCFLHSDLDPSHERAAAAELGGLSELGEAVDVVCSCDVSPEFRDYERTVTTVANAYLLRPCRDYLSALATLAPEVLVMTSAGGLIPVVEAADVPVALLLSGPAGGVLAASTAARAAGWPSCVTFDMGGTSTDVCLILDGRPEPAAERSVAGLPVRRPALDVHTIGAGGGSIARVDPGGALAVGPQSAGADPGPACYGRGGDLPTVTDADLVLGRLPEDGLPGLGALDADAAERALAGAGVDPAGVIAVVDDAMVQAIRVVSVQRGVDPSGLALVAFGGAGPLHACALADALGMPAVVVPPRAGVLSAVGLLGARRQVELVRSWERPGERDGLDRALDDLVAEARRRLDGPAASILTATDCRYAGQGHEITVATPDDFVAEHERRNGFVMAGAAVEVVALRVTATGPAEVDVAALPAPDRQGPRPGPAVIAEPDCTIWVAEGWTARVDPSGSWILTRDAQ